MRSKFILFGACALIGWQLAAGLSAAAAQSAAAAGRATQLANRYWQLRVITTNGQVCVRFQNKPLDLCLAEGPYLYRAERSNDQRVETCRGLQDAQVTTSLNQLVIRGRLAGLEVEQRFELLPGRPVLEERITLRNATDTLISLSDFEAGFIRPVTDQAGQVSADIREDRWVAVPLRARATDPKGYVNDFSIQDLITKAGYEPRVNKDLQYSQFPSRHRAAEGWAWTHKSGTLGIFVFNQENMLFSVVSAQKEAKGATLRFGGACMISGEPAALSRIAPGQTVDLGTLRYQSLQGGYPEAMYAFRALLDEKGCRFPADYNPPVHWEQLYDMPNAWEDRPHRYTKAIVEKEAAKGRAYSCEALYLDPGWDTEFGTFLWGEQWLGTRREFVADMQSEFGLKLALHCPLATWVSHQFSWGLGAVKSWPAAAARMAPPEATSAGEGLLVPAVRDGQRNLALLPAAKAAASSVYQGGAMPIHQVAHLNDGWYGNRASWIADRMPAWAEIDLGAVYQIGKVALGNDHARQYTDRAATRLRILVATNYIAESQAASWRTVAEYEGAPLAEERIFAFAPVAARWVRVDILKGGPDMPRLDEIEVYDAKPVSSEEAAAFARLAKRGPAPPPATQMTGPTLCLGSRQYLDEAERRLLANCADGAVFLMYDGNWWNGGCVDPAHGHPVPYRLEDHIRANLDLAQRIHAKYPKVLIEMHDPGAGGSSARVMPVYYKYGLPGSYDENWGFELMWDPLADLKETRSRSLYYYNMGCNVPLYLHIDLRKDNESCVILWWYASTCRHLGIGGTSPKPAVVEAQQQAMRRYRQLEGFYKRGEFYGLNEEIHLHVLPKESAFVVNLFNLSDQTRTLSGTCSLARLGLDPRKSYRTTTDWATVKNGQFNVTRSMPPWSTQVAEFRPGGK
jgi:hypothetical protein